ncbi:MAG TPA: high frequency lysogenization protein HflD [Pseudidiomarina sp.]|nr:high frequency lysogenization protein HflD [Pseudidiomarina sp.]
MNLDEWQQRVLALAAIAQSAAAVKQVAREGSLRQPAYGRPLIDSVLNQNPSSFSAIYPEPQDLRWGLEQLLQQIGATRDKDVEMTRYVVGILALARKLMRSEKAQHQLGQRIEQLYRQQHDFQFNSETIIAGMASAYSDFVSPLSHPLKINGKPDYLKQATAQNHIRAYLLAGVRNAVLWNHLGGKRRHFLFSRQRMVRTAQSLLRTLQEQSESPS